MTSKRLVSDLVPSQNNSLLCETRNHIRLSYSPEHGQGKKEGFYTLNKSVSNKDFLAYVISNFGQP
jgi:hypothetical protein